MFKNATIIKYAVRLYMRWLLNYFLNPAHLPVDQPNLDAMGVMGRFCQDIPDQSPCQLAGALVFFQDNINCYSGAYIPAVSAVHCSLSFAIKY